uniref:Uncharacterized protein n=1 Tax=Glossina morsitans morsitans TaxID=37546 RepID=A0A1B0FLS8_GLOMM
MKLCLFFQFTKDLNGPPPDYVAFGIFIVNDLRLSCSAVLSGGCGNDIRSSVSAQLFKQLFSQDVIALVDTGASVSCFTSDYAKGFLQEKKWEKFTVSLTSPSQMTFLLRRVYLKVPSVIIPSQILICLVLFRELVVVKFSLVLPGC